MTNFSKLQQAYQQLGMIESDKVTMGIIKYARNLMVEFMVDNEPKKKGAFNIWDYTSDDPIRPVVQGVYHDPEKKCAVATNCHILVADSDLYDESSVYTGDEIPPMRPVDRYGNFICGRFPNWKGVIKDRTDDFKTYHIDPKEVEDYIKKCNSYMKLNGMTGRARMTPTYVIKEVAAFNAEFLRLFLIASGGEINIESPTKGAFYWSDKRTVLLMPVELKAEETAEGIYLR